MTLLTIPQTYMTQPPSPAAQDDYIWRFDLHHPHPPQALHADPRVEFMREQLLNLLEVVALYHGDEPVPIDRFRVLGGEATLHAIYPATLPTRA